MYLIINNLLFLLYEKVDILITGKLGLFIYLPVSFDEALAGYA